MHEFITENPANYTCLTWRSETVIHRPGSHGRVDQMSESSTCPVRRSRRTIVILTQEDRSEGFLIILAAS